MSEVIFHSFLFVVRMFTRSEILFFKKHKGDSKRSGFRVVHICHKSGKRPLCVECWFDRDRT